jgi:hypothetical protein
MQTLWRGITNRPGSKTEGRAFPFNSPQASPAEAAVIAKSHKIYAWERKRVSLENFPCSSIERMV